MSISDLETALAPVVEAQEEQLSLLEQLIEAVQYDAHVTMGVILGIGLCAGLILIWILLDRFR